MSEPTIVPRADCPRCQGGPETFHYYRGLYVFDVDRARELVSDGRDPVEVDPESVSEAVAESEIDDFHIPHVDASIPGIIAHLRYRTEEGADVSAHVLIDGHHRAARCLRDGLAFFARLLAEDESRAILLRDQGTPVVPETVDESSPTAKEIAADFERRFPGSRQMAQRARQVLAGAREERRGYGPFGVRAQRGQGPWIWDVDGQRLIDLWMGQGALLAGHHFVPVIDAVQRQLEKGTQLTSHEGTIRWAELIAAMVPSAERVRFTSSGTEAMMLALRATRAYTRRDGILMFVGHYHGWHDEALAHLYDPSLAGLHPAAPDHVVRLSPDRPEEVFARIAQEDLAAVVVEPGGGAFGGFPIERAFLAELRERTRQQRTLLVFDEATTAFRDPAGSVQAALGIVPDLTVLAKIVAGGLPGGALVGRERYMAVFGPGTPRSHEWVQAPHGGAFDGNPLSAAAGIAMLEAVRDGRLAARAQTAANALADRINRAALSHSVDVAVYTNGMSILHLLLGARKKEIDIAPSPAIHALYAERPDLYTIFRQALLLEGVDSHLTHAWISAEHDDPTVLRELGEAYERVFKRLAALPGFRT